MKIKFKNIILDNFLSFEHAELQLNDSGFVSVKGMNTNPDDLALSNGSGKSSLFEAINWCLCGETIRGAKDVTRIDSNGTCSVELNCIIDKKEVKINRTKDPSNLKIFINGENKSGKGIRDTEKLLEEYFPDLTGQLIGSVIILGQGLPGRFTNNTPSGRKEVLEKLSKSDFMIRDLSERISKRKQELNLRVRENEDLSLKNKTKISMNEKIIIDNQTKLLNLVPPSIDDINYNKSKLESIETKKRSIEDERTSIYSELEKVHDEINKINNLKFDEISKVREEKNKALNGVMDMITMNEVEVKNLNAELFRLSNIKDVCPTCGQKLQGVEKPDTSHLEESINEKKATLQKLWEEEKLTTTKYKNEENDIELKYGLSLSELNSNKDKIDSKLSESNINLVNVTAEYQQVSATLKQLEMVANTYTETVSTLNKLIDDAKSENSTLEQELLYINSEHNVLCDKLDVVNKMSSLITRDFRGYLLINVIDFINKKSKEYAQELFETDKISFELSGNNINISYDGKDYQNLSGGEKQKVDIIVQFSIRDMLCTYLDFSSNILVLDEISDNIDSVGAERLFNMISNKLKDVETIFIISHHSDFQLPVDSELTVIKGQDKISRII